MNAIAVLMIAVFGILGTVPVSLANDGPGAEMAIRIGEPVAFQGVTYIVQKLGENQEGAKVIYLEEARSMIGPSPLPELVPENYGQIYTLEKVVGGGGGGFGTMHWAPSLD